MKKVFWVAVVLCVVASGLLFAAAPSSKNAFSNTGDKTVDNQYTGSWDVLDSLIVIRSDSGATIITVTGIAVLDPGERLYLGLGHDSANRTSETNLAPNSDLDTTQMAQPYGIKGRARVPFSFSYGISGNGALTDTIYLNAACGSSAGPVEVEDVCVTGRVADKWKEDV